MDLTLHDLSSPARLRKRLAPLRQDSGRRIADLCRAAARLEDMDAASHLGFSSKADYRREGLGVKPSRWRRWVRVGRLLLRHPLFHQDLLDTRVCVAVLDELVRAVPDPALQLALRPLVLDKPVRQVRRELGAMLQEEEERRRREEQEQEQADEVQREGSGTPAATPLDPTAEPDPEWLPFTARVPLPAADYLRDTFLLTRAKAGCDLPDNLLLGYVLMEASDAVPALVESHAEAHRSFGHLVQGRRLPHHRHPKQTKPPRVPTHLPPSLTDPGQRTETVRRRHVHVLHRWVVRLLGRLREHRLDQEDRLLQLMREGVHARAGHATFWTFCEEVLDLNQWTARRMVQRAEQRRRDHPLALALADGSVTEIQYELLLRLHRRCFVPRSCLPAWVHYAARTTVRRLRDAVAWARARHERDHAAWTGRDCPPPTDEELATSTPSLLELAQNPDPVDLQDWERAPRTTMEMVLDRETADLLLLYLACLQQRGRQINAFDFPPWLLLVQIFHLARQAWATREEVPLPRHQRALFDRYGWRCMVPGCTRRAQLHNHHLVFRSRGGPDEPWNLLPLCAFHHLQGVHGTRMRMTGRADPTGRDLTVSLGLRPDGRALWTWKGERLIRAG